MHGGFLFVKCWFPMALFAASAAADVCCALLQENAARLKAYKAKLVVFPKRSNKPKAGDSSAEDLKNVPQHKGTILPLMHEKPKLETVKLTDELKVSPETLHIFAFMLLKAVD